MGIRCDQDMGLNVWAQNFVEGKKVLAYIERTLRIYPDGETKVMPDHPILVSNVGAEESGEHYVGMFEDEYPLHKYTFQDGKVFYERVQDCPWSSGPVFFLALQDESGQWVRESLWPDEDIGNA